MRTKWTVLGICALLAFVMTGFCGCSDGGEPEAVETAPAEEVESAEEREAGETVDMGNGVSMVNIPDSNADFPARDCPDGVGFTGKMAKYPVTNAQYAHYLNAALASGDIEVDDNQVRGKTGNYAGERYYRLDGPGGSWAGATNGGKSRISYSAGVFSVDSGFENHPVTYVSWYGATAFAEYYGWRLPTEWEWESVANYNENRTYATGSSLYDSERFFANYQANGNDSNPPSDIPYHPYVEYGTTPVGHFGTFGYGLAGMSGNVWEWTSSLWSSTSSSRILRGGGWDRTDRYCTVSYRRGSPPDYQNINWGFRVCR